MPGRWNTAILVVIALGACSPAAWAENRGFYLGGSWGAADHNADVSDFDDNSIVAGQVQATDDAWKAFIGWRFGRYFALEGGFTDLGQVRFVGISDGSGFFYGCLGEFDPDCVPGPVEEIRSTDGLFVTGVGLYPLGSFELFAKVGFYARDTDFFIEDALGIQQADTDSSTSILGLGFQFRVVGGFRVRFEAERYFDISMVDVDMVSLGLLWQFGHKK